MNVVLAPGKYVIAVSGGVDSMVLLDVLRQQAGVELVVTHFDHGIRSDSAEDRRLVQATARQHNLPFIYEAGHLGPEASEATAREVRYAFLRRVLQTQGAQGIITAHHQDDALETAILNWLRGTGRKGFAALQTQGDMLRPLLHVPKQELRAYARERELVWREDSTNTDERYLRNYIRHRLMPRLDESAQARLLTHIAALWRVNRELDQQLTNVLHVQPSSDAISRRWFISLPYAVAAEVLAAWLRQQGIRSFDKKLIARLVAAAKTAQPGKRYDVNQTYLLVIHKNVVQITPRDLRQNSGGHV